jgi:hypothetical protein
MKLPEIDWTKIASIGARATELHQSGRMDRETWLGLVSEFGTASHGRLEMPAVLSRSGRTEWIGEPRRVSGRVA